MGTIYTRTGRCEKWGGEYSARRVTHLSPEERAAIMRGEDVRLSGCPPYMGETDRRIIERGGRFYCRMP